MKVTNVESDLYQNSNQKIGSNVINIEIAKKQFQFPMVAPHQSELAKAQAFNIKLNSPLLQFIHRVEKSKRITDDIIKEHITENLRKIIESNPTLIVDSFFQFWQEYLPTLKERNNILDIQYQAGSKIISDYETKQNQSLTRFEKQISTAIPQFQNRIYSPTLDIGTISVELFEEKIDLLFEYSVKRFNIIYRSFIDTQDNWIALSKKLYQKKIWCNVVGIPQQYYSTLNKFSLVAAVFFYGAHTASLQYPRFPPASDKPSSDETYAKTSLSHRFNVGTGKFEIIDNESTDKSRANSVNDLIAYTSVIKPKIISKTYYSEFIPTQPGLSGLLQTIG